MADEQSKLWNGLAGSGWVEAQELTDQMFRPFEPLLTNGIGAGSGARVLDVGCGTGSTTLAVARVVGAEGACTGLDISEPMITAARARAEREGVAAHFLVADAQTHAFAPESFDAIVSRFGVMFFDNPVEAFANLRRAAKRDAQLRVIAFRSAAENDFMTLAERTAAPMLPALSARRTDGPGQFSFADRERVRAILDASGWTGIDIQPIDVECTLPAERLGQYVTQLGPVARMLHQIDAETHARVIETVCPAFGAYVQGDEMRFNAACWMITAH